MNTQNDIEHLVAKGNISGALEELLKISNGTRLNKDVLTLKSTYESGKKIYLRGGAENQEMQLLDSKTAFSILSYYNELISENLFDLEAKHTPIKKDGVNINHFRGTWLSYRHKIDYKDGELDFTADKKNIFVVALVFTPISHNKCDVRSIFITKSFVGTLTVIGKRAFIELNEEGGDKKVLVTLHLKNTNNPEGILKGIANTYITDGEKNNNPEIGVPLIFEKQINDFAEIEDKTEYKNIKEIDNQEVKLFLLRDKRFISILPFRKRNISSTLLKSVIGGALLILGFTFIVNHFAEHKYNFTIYTTIPKKVNFVWAEYDSLKNEMYLASEGKISILFKEISTDSFKAYYDSLRNSPNADFGLIGVPYYDTEIKGFVTKSFFSTIPFGMKNSEFNAWLSIDGQKKFEDCYHREAIYPIPIGNTGMQAGGWYFEKIRNLKQLEGKTMRILGPGEEVLSRFNVKMETGLPTFSNVMRWSKNPDFIGFEVINPAFDQCLGLCAAADTLKKDRKLYFYPTGWHEPNSTYTLYFNEKKINEIKQSSKLTNTFLLVFNKYHNRLSNRFETEGSRVLNEWRSNSKLPFTIIDTFPTKMLDSLKLKTIELINEPQAKPDYKNVFESYSKFHFENGGMQLRNK